MKNKAGNDPVGKALIDSAETLGLEGVEDSLAYRVEEIEKHLHNREKWFGLATVPNAELHVADRMNGIVAPFRITAGNQDFGSWVQILGSTDTPVTALMEKYDGHRFMVTDTNSTAAFIIQIVAGEFADIAARLADEEFTEAPYKAATNSNDSGISDLLSSRIPVGGKAWARCACYLANATFIDFYFGIHEYSG